MRGASVGTLPHLHQLSTCEHRSLSRTPRTHDSRPKMNSSDQDSLGKRPCVVCFAQGPKPLSLGIWKWVMHSNLFLRGTFIVHKKCLLNK